MSFLSKIKLGSNVRVQIIDQKSVGFNAAVRWSVKEEIEKRVKEQYLNIRKYAQNTVEYYILNSPTVMDLKKSTLRIDLGLSEDAADSAISEIASFIKSQVSVVYRTAKRGKNIYGLDIVLLPNPNFYKDISAGTYYSFGYYASNPKYNPSGQPFEISWLEWLMTRGTEVINSDFYVFYKEGEGRSGGGFMLNKNKLRSSKKSFRIDPEHAGTIEDNFVTKAIAASIPEIIAFVKKRLG